MLNRAFLASSAAARMAAIAFEFGQILFRCILAIDAAIARIAVRPTRAYIVSTFVFVFHIHFPFFKNFALIREPFRILDGLRMRAIALLYAPSRAIERFSPQIDNSRPFEPE